MNKIKLFIADDQQVIRDGLRNMLSNENEFEIIGEAGNGKELLVKIEVLREKPDIILMDVKMPQMNGIETTELISKKHLIKVVALSVYDDETSVTKIIRAGAKGYILKNASKNELITALRKINSGETYYSNELVTKFINKQIHKVPEPGVLTDFENNPIELTTREKEIIKLIANEMTNYEISEKLFISQRTVEAHRRNLLKKLVLKNTAGLVKYAINNGLA